LHLPSGLLLTAAELEELAGCTMMVNHSDSLPLKRVKHRFIEHHKRPVFPQQRSFAIESKSLSNYWQQIVATLIPEIPRADLCPHIPPIEWSTGIEFFSSSQQHIRQSRKSIPLQPKRVEPLMIRML
jgi:hypothetical protein